jgi:K+-H+ exchange-related protein
MDVYVIPCAVDRYELYCEPADDGDETRQEASSGFFGGLLERFRVMLGRLDRHQAVDPGDDERRGWTRRLRDRAMRWMAEKVAEQRLLWRLRTHPVACAFYPQDLSEAQATAIVRQLLQRDADRHRLWLSFHAVGFVLSGVFFFVPGPNIIAYYFAFRLVGHYLSMRGSRHGLNGVHWTYDACEPLTELRRVRTIARRDREQYVGEIAARLRLAHLPRFFKRTADWGA